MEWNTTNDICGIEFDPFRVGNTYWCRVPWALPTAINFHAFSVKLSYSYRKDSMGSRRAAFQAGQSPKIKPMPTLATRPPIGAQSGT
jgi:hypothetical protein